jgi:hypothetical protein
MSQVHAPSPLPLAPEARTQSVEEGQVGGGTPSQAVENNHVTLLLCRLAAAGEQAFRGIVGEIAAPGTAAVKPSTTPARPINLPVEREADQLDGVVNGLARQIS